MNTNHQQLPSGIDNNHDEDGNMAKYYENWKVGGMSTDDVERCKTFFDQGTEIFPGADRKLAYRLCWLGHWLINSRRWFFLDDNSISVQQAVKFALIHQHHWLPATVEQMTPAEMSLALTDYWADYRTQPTEPEKALIHMTDWQYQKLCSNRKKVNGDQ